MTVIDSFDLFDQAGQKIGRVDGSRGTRGEPVVEIRSLAGVLVCQLSGGEVARLAKLLAALREARR